MVSVVIRCIGRENIPGLLAMLMRQTVTPSELIIVMDSDSEAERAFVDEELKKYPLARLVALSHAEFSHAYSTNLGVENAHGELVCLTNGHSMPMSTHWLESGLEHFADELVAGVSSYFVASENRITKELHELLQRMFWKPHVSTINCIIRRRLWREYPFNVNLAEEIPEAKQYGGEDYDWSLEMVMRGYRIVMEPEFTVVHSHNRSAMSEMYRNVRNYFVYRNLEQKIEDMKMRAHAGLDPR